MLAALARRGVNGLLVPAALVCAGLFLSVAAVDAQQQRGRGAAPGSPFGGLGGDSKEPIKIDADKLDVLDKENRAVFSGNVVAVQGETTVRCSTMTVFYEGRQGPGAKPAAQPAQAGQGGDSNIRKIDCQGPVTVVSKTQAATANHAVFDRASNTVIMTGNVALNDGPNVTRGERLVYNTETGVANVENSKGRVLGYSVPNATEGAQAKPGAKPATGKPATPTN